MVKRQSSKNLREALLARLGIKSPTLSNRIKKIKTKHALSPVQALWVMAADSGIDLHKFVDDDDLASAHKILARIGGPTRVVGIDNARVAKQIATSDGKGIEVKLPSGKFFSDSALSSKVTKELTEMAKHYPTLYILENSIRELFREVMGDTFGADWWDKNFNSTKMSKVKKLAEQRMNDIDLKMRWHQKTSNHPLDYTTIEGLGKLMLSKRAMLFPGKLGVKDTWFENFIDELAATRNVLCHMNPLNKTSIKNLNLRYDQWLKVCRDYKMQKP